MPTADSQSRIEELKARWEADPSSRIFVQLADEYRRQGRNAEAIAVLEKGLVTQPHYVSAQVALGRCQLAAGEAQAAIQVLTRVTDQDPSHPLAGKLLVEAHLEAGEIEEASQRLELYRMLADSGPEIEELEQLVEQGRKSHTESPSPAPVTSGATATAASFPGTAPETGADEPATEPSATDRLAVEDLVFDLDPTDLPPPLDPFDLSDSPGSVDTSEPFLFDSPPEPASGEEPERREVEGRSATLDDAPTGEAAKTGAAEGEEPFGDLLASDDLSRWSHGFRDEGIFELGVGGPSPPAAEPSHPATGPTPDRERPVEESGDREEATVTLGQLYMAQGHREEAARIFRAILDQDPTNEVSLAALAKLEGVEPIARVSEPVPWEPPPLTDSEPSLGAAGSEPGHGEVEEEAERVGSPLEPPPSRGGVTARKIAALEDYLNRLRQMAQ